MDNDKLIDRLDRKKDKQREKTKRKSEERAAFGGVFDSYTSINLNKLMAKGVITEFVGIISAGKEANVYYALGENNQPLAVKIYKIDPQNTKWMKNYIVGDPRFKKIGNSTHKIIYTWCKKEFRNLKQIYNNGINCPEPMYFKGNILIMKFIGDEDGTPALKLKDCVGQFTDPEREMKVSLEFIKLLYEKANLIHGDFSEFNILYHQKVQHLIDVSQAVSKNHPKAKYFLSRDIANITKFYEKLGIKTPNPSEIYYEIVGNSEIDS